jgi:rod shape determining protein RodA
MRQESQLQSQHIDWLTLLIYTLFVLAGWINIYAAVYEADHASIFDISQNYGKQLIWIGVSAFIALMIMLVDDKFFYAFSYGLYGVMIVLNIAVLFFSKEVKGAHAWFEIGSFRLQPAEFAKFATALALARYMSHFDFSLGDRKHWAYVAAIILMPMGVILAQNDTGSALVYCSFVFVLYREGLPGWILFIGLALGIISVLALVMDPNILIYILIGLALVAAVLLRASKQGMVLVAAVLITCVGLIKGIDYLFYKLQPHQQQRINVLLGKEVDLKGAGYNVHQSKIAIGSGGLLGKGFLEGTQTKFNFVPEQSTDFIFCTVGEEYGFAGSATLILLFVVLFIRLIVVAERQRNKFNRIYGYCVASILFFHFTINIGMTIGLLPVIGIPLPFFSYGGSSLISFTVLLFILLRLDASRVYQLRGNIY